jgi:hypothetical protein
LGKFMLLAKSCCPGQRWGLNWSVPVLKCNIDFLWVWQNDPILNSKFFLKHWENQRHLNEFMNLSWCFPGGNLKHGSPKKGTSWGFCGVQRKERQFTDKVLTSCEWWRKQSEDGKEYAINTVKPLSAFEF